MAQVDGHLTFDTEINESGFSSGIKKIGNVGKKGLGLLTASIAGITGVTAAMTTGISTGIKFNASIEQYITSFEVMTGSAEKAAEIMQRLQKIGAETPFETEDIAETTQLLMNYGFTADDAIDKMQMLGDISQGSAEKMNRIATAYGQMSSAGKVTLEDVKQMIEAGFNPLREISESTGESMSSLYDRISDGTVAVDEITDSMIRSTSEGGKYFQSMDKQSQTLNGRLSTLSDTVKAKLGEGLQNVSDILRDKIIPWATEAVESLDFDAIFKTVKKLVPLLTAVGTAMAGWKISKRLTPLVTGFQEAKVALALFKLQSDGMTISQAALNGMLTKTQIATAAMTGQMTLSTAATALATKASAAFNAVLSANPIGLVVTALALLAGGLAIAKTAFGDSSDEASKLKEEIEVLTDDMEAYREKMDDLEETRKTTIENGMGELNYYQGLSDELGRLVDENGKVQEGYETRANFIVTTLNEALGTEISMTDGVISNYQDLSASIEDVINKKKAELILSAYEEEYQEALKNRNTIYESIIKQEEAVALATEEYEAAKRGSNLRTIEVKRQALEDEREILAQFEQDLGENTNVITNYERMQADAFEGKVESVIASTGDLKDAYTDMTAMTKEELQKQIDETNAKLNEASEKYELTGAEIYKTEKESYQKQLDEFKNHMEEMQRAPHTIDWNASGGYIIDGILYGINTREYKLINKARTLATTISQKFNNALEIESPSRVMAESGGFVVAGIEQGIEDKTPSLLKTVAQMATSLINKTRGIDFGDIVDSTMGKINYAMYPDSINVMRNRRNTGFIDNRDRDNATGPGEEKRYIIEMPVNLDGKEIARGTVSFTDSELAERERLARRGVTA